VASPARVPVATVAPTDHALSALRPLQAGEATISGGFWAARQRLNRERSLAHGFAELERAGNLNNLRLAGGASGTYQAAGLSSGLVFPFLDTDVYKWLEAVAWELGRAPSAELSRAADKAITAVAEAQREDGYLNTYVQVLAETKPYDDLQWGHELYSYGHLTQAAVAWHSVLGDDRLLDVALRAIASVEREFGSAERPPLDGHPVFETALVELYRANGDERFLKLAARMIDERGHGLIGEGRFGSAYWQDLEPVREARSVAGHAVRQLYLDAGAVDVATELGDERLLEAVQRRWRDLVATRTYLTGGMGSRARDEAFGDPFELPPDQAYAETCAGVASVMLAWRLLLATGDPACADLIERTIFNEVLAGSSLEGTEFFYTNPLQRRTERVAAEPGSGRRARWQACACCPPNLMRLLSSWEQYLATSDRGGVQIHQYATGEVRATVEGGVVRLAVETDYPWDGRVVVRVVESPSEPWSLSLRVPGWCQSASVRVNSGESQAGHGGTRWASPSQAWRRGDEIVLTMDMPVRVTQPDPRIDEIRGCLALERGPLVYCIESTDLPEGVILEDVVLEPTVRPRTTARPDIAESMVGLIVPAIHRPAPSPSEWPYRRSGGGGHRAVEARPIDAEAIPYFAWANRGDGAMRVWIPVRA
jgi:uncharacterized protein